MRSRRYRSKRADRDLCRSVAMPDAGGGSYAPDSSYGGLSSGDSAERLLYVTSFESDGEPVGSSAP
jgi:hypothetical protein